MIKMHREMTIGMTWEHGNDEETWERHGNMK